MGREGPRRAEEFTFWSIQVLLVDVESADSPFGYASLYHLRRRRRVVDSMLERFLLQQWLCCGDIYLSLSLSFVIWTQSILVVQ
jgi:hypothetical protein